jgi:TonB family protein
MTPMTIRLRSVAPLFALLLAVPAASAAAQDKVYTLAEVNTPPKLAAPSAAMRAIQSSYPSHLKSNGVAGEVEVQFVVAPTGKVESGSVEVLDASSAEFGPAAKTAVEKLEFTPAKVGNAAVRARVVLPISYRP